MVTRCRGFESPDASASRATTRRGAASGKGGCTGRSHHNWSPGASRKAAGDAPCGPRPPLILRGAGSPETWQGIDAMTGDYSFVLVLAVAALLVWVLFRLQKGGFCRRAVIS